jgi:hypothetical protein
MAMSSLLGGGNFRQRHDLFPFAIERHKGTGGCDESHMGVCAATGVDFPLLVRLAADAILLAATARRNCHRRNWARHNYFDGT